VLVERDLMSSEHLTLPGVLRGSGLSRLATVRACCAWHAGCRSGSGITSLHDSLQLGLSLFQFGLCRGEALLELLILLGQ